MKPHIYLLLIWTLLTGCVSVMNRDKQSGHLYPGVNSDMYGIKCVWIGGKLPLYQRVPMGILGTTVFLVDMPFSFVADTALIPFDLSQEPSEFHVTPLMPAKECTQ